MPTVFVSQLPHRLDRATGVFVPGYNIDPANEHGQVKILVPPQAPYTDSRQILPQLSCLLKYNFKAGDCLLLLGDPVVTATIVALVAKKGDSRELRWDRNIGKYIPVVVSMRLAA